MSFSRPTVDNRKEVYLALVNSVEGQLRDAYADRHERGLDNQSTIARKLGVGRSVVNRRLSGRGNLTLETIADMVWALGQCINVDIFDPSSTPSNSARVVSEHMAAPREGVPVMSAAPTTEVKIVLRELEDA